MDYSMYYRELEMINKEYLDTLDLEKYINISNNVRTIMDMIENDYNNKSCLPPELEGYIFNHLGENGVAYYLADRYGKCVYKKRICKYILYS